MINLNKKCRGCAHDGGCLITKHTKLVKMCPCTICLVKGICGYLCDERIKLYVEQYRPFALVKEYL